MHFMSKVSVITPFYEEPVNMLEKNVLSVSSQITNHQIEHIIICDKPEREPELMENFKQWIELINLQTTKNGYYCKILFPEKNLGLPGARNFGIENAVGEYIMTLDTDDRFVDFRVERQINYMLENNLDHCYGGFREWHWGKEKAEESKVIPPEFDINYLKNLNNICYCGSNCFTRKVYDTVGGFDEKLNGVGAEDLEYWLRLSLNGFKSALFPDVLYYLGITNNNMTAHYVKEGRFEKAFDYIKKKHNLN